MTKVFLTGGSGFIGQALIKRLIKEDWMITALTRLNREDKGVIWVKGDIRERGWIREIGEIREFIYLAGVHGHIRMPFKERLSIELDGLKNAVAAAKAAKVKHFIYLSTAYTNLGTEYSKAKSIAQKWFLKEIKNGFPGILVCPVTVYGPGDLNNLSRLFTAIAKKKFFFIGSGKVNYYSIYIEDLMDALMLILKNPKKLIGQTLTLGDNKVVTFKEFVGVVANQQNIPPPKIHLPKTLMFTLGKFFSFLSKFKLPVPFTQDTVKTLTFNQNFDFKRSNKILKFKPQTTLEEGIKKTARWYKLKKII